MSSKEKEIVLMDGDFTIGEVLSDLVDLSMPHRIYGEAFRGQDERPDIDVACILTSLIHAAIWGAQNKEWVLAFAERKKEQLDDEWEEIAGEFFDDGSAVH